MRDPRNVEGAVAAAGHYSHCVIANGFVFVSGQGPVDPATGRMPDDFAGQVRQTLKNVEAILKGAGTDFSQAVKVNAYLSDVTRFAEYNAVYKEFFPSGAPARTTVGSQLIGIQVEIDCIATLPDTR